MIELTARILRRFFHLMESLNETSLSHMLAQTTIDRLALLVQLFLRELSHR